MCIDNLNISPFLRYLRRDDQGNLIVPEGWHCRTFTQKRGDIPGLPGTSYTYCVGKKPFIHVRAGEGIIDSVRVNPARLLHGHHGGLLKNDAELQEAFQLVQRRLDDISSLANTNEPEKWKFTSIEIGWNLSVPFAELERRLLAATHPWVRRPQRYCRGKEITIQGGDFTLKIYNKSALLRKCREAKGPLKDITRVEVVLSGKKLKKVTGLHGYGALFSFHEAWNWLHACLGAMKVPTVKFPKKDEEHNALAQLCALALADGYSPNGMNPLDFALLGKSDSTRARLSKAVHAVRMAQQPWSWFDYLPLANPIPVELQIAALPR